MLSCEQAEEHDERRARIKQSNARDCLHLDERCAPFARDTVSNDCCHCYYCSSLCGKEPVSDVEGSIHGHRSSSDKGVKLMTVCLGR